MKKESMILPFELKALEIKKDEAGNPTRAEFNGHAAYKNNVDLGGDKIVNCF